MGEATPAHQDSDSAHTAVQDLALDQARAQANALLHEVDHRVRNNLQLICSLILLQSRRLEDAAAREVLRGILERVNAIAIVHRRLFQTGDIQRFDVAQFIRDLVGDLVAERECVGVEIQMDLERFEVSAAQAAPLALIVNELVVNALRHAFPGGRAGTVNIRARRLDGHFEVSVRDDGVGLASAATPTPGFGLTIADLLCKQLSAHCSFAAGEPGAVATVRLPITL